jgi:hypothetical protein
MVTGAVPAEFSVRGKVDAVFTVTLPNARLAGLIVNCELATAAAFSCRAKVLETLPALAVSVTACADVTDDTVAVNPALVAFAGTINVAGTVTAALLLARLTVRPPLTGAAVNITVQLSLPDSVIDALLQENVLNVAAALVPVFTVTPQPNGRRATSKHDNMANSFAERRSSLGIEPRLEAQSELSTSFTCIVRALQRGKRIVASTTLETSETTALSIRRYHSAEMPLLVCRRPTLFKYEGHLYQGLLPHDRNLSMTPIGHRAWETLLEAQRAHGTIVQRVATNVARNKLSCSSPLEWRRPRAWK